MNPSTHVSQKSQLINEYTKVMTMFPNISTPTKLLATGNKEWTFTAVMGAAIPLAP